MFNKNDGKPVYFKSSGLNFKAPSEGSRICAAYYASFDTVDSDYDIIRKGAFKKSLSERGVDSASNRRIKFLYQHDIDEPCATYKVLKEDSIGLYGEHEIEKTPLGDVILERYANGELREHSIGFKYVWDKCQWIKVPMALVPAELDCEEYIDPNTGQPTGTTMVFECRELNLFENSVVTFGANQNTPFLGFKGNSEDLVSKLEDELDFLIKNAPTFEYEYKIRKAWASQISLAKSLADNTKEQTKPKNDIKPIDINKLITNFSL